MGSYQRPRRRGWGERVSHLAVVDDLPHESAVGLVGDLLVIVKVGVHDHDVERVDRRFIFFASAADFTVVAPKDSPIGGTTAAVGRPHLMAEMAAVAEAWAWSLAEALVLVAAATAVATAVSFSAHVMDIRMSPMTSSGDVSGVSGKYPAVKFGSCPCRSIACPNS